MTETLELIDLEQLLNNNPHCEIKHNITTCTQEVTHVIRGQCGPPFLMCAAATSFKVSKMNAGVVCACGSPAIDCWKIHPV